MELGSIFAQFRGPWIWPEGAWATELGQLVIWGARRQRDLPTTLRLEFLLSDADPFVQGSKKVQRKTWVTWYFLQLLFSFRKDWIAEAQDPHAETECSNQNYQTTIYWALTVSVHCAENFLHLIFIVKIIHILRSQVLVQSLLHKHRWPPFLSASTICSSEGAGSVSHASLVDTAAPGAGAALFPPL